MSIMALALLSVLSHGDTVRMDANVVLEHAVAHSPVVSAARFRVEGSTHSLAHAGAWLHPQVTGAAENLGIERETTGVEGWRGLEGQVLLEAALPLGGDRGAAIARARAGHDAAVAGHALAEAEVRTRVLEAIALAERDRRLALSAAEERAELERFAVALEQGAEEGRFATGDAARARLAAVMAVTEEARRRASAASSGADLVRLAGLPLDSELAVTLPACTRPSAISMPGASPESALVAARAAAATADLALDRARRIPDLHPQIGLRRVAGLSGVYVGLGFDLPLFTRQGDAVAAARAERDAVQAEQAEVQLRLEVERNVASRVLGLLEDAGLHFDEQWWDALELSVSAVQASFEFGEATLVEVLDSRRARLAALDELERWRAEVRTARIRAARLDALPLRAELLCNTDTAEEEG